jgi:hypothetical protein
MKKPNPMNIESGEGILEIDYDRGLIYFHDNATGRTILRICRLKIPDSFDASTDMIDITHMVGVSYGGKP